MKSRKPTKALPFEAAAMRHPSCNRRLAEVEHMRNRWPIPVTTMMLTLAVGASCDEPGAPGAIDIEVSLLSAPREIQCLRVVTAGTAETEHWLEVKPDPDWRGRVSAPVGGRTSVRADGYGVDCLNARTSHPGWMAASTDVVAETNGPVTIAFNLQTAEAVSTNTHALSSYPPAIGQVLPANGAIGISSGTNIQVRFNQKMNRASGQAAFQILSPNGVSGVFSWNADGSLLTFNPDAQFQYGQTVQFEIAAGALSVDGTPKATTERFSFRIMRSLMSVLTSVGSLDGYLKDTGKGSIASQYILVGDTADGHYTRGFVSFDLSALPANLVSITDAAVVLTIHESHGRPDRLAPLYALDVDYAGALGGTSDFGGSGWPTEHLFSIWPERASAEGAGNWVRERWKVRRETAYRCQFRIQYEHNFHFEFPPLADYLEFYSGDHAVEAYRPQLRVTYLIP
jgi:hypothetical protein